MDFHSRPSRIAVVRKERFDFRSRAGCGCFEGSFAKDSWYEPSFEEDLLRCSEAGCVAGFATPEDVS